jgi:invasion protein IalB
MSQAFAQAPVPKAQPKAPVPKSQPKGGEAPAQPQGEQPKLSFTLTKVCPKGQEANAKAVCLTGRDGAVETGLPVVAAVLIEPEGEPRKTLRVTLPLGMALQPGTRVVIDEGQPMTAPYVICAGNGCMADSRGERRARHQHEEGQRPCCSGRQRCRSGGLAAAAT